MPSAPLVIFTPPSGGGSPAAAGVVFEPAPAGKAALSISGAATAGVNGTVYYAGRIDNNPAWSRDGTLVHSATNPMVFETSGVWFVQLNNGAIYSATKTSAAASPEGLTGWFVGTGSGAPVIAIGTVAPPAVITA